MSLTGIPTVTARPVDNLTFVTLRTAEFGFLGLAVKTRRQTPLFCGHPTNAFVWSLCLFFNYDFFLLIVLMLPFFSLS